MLAREKWQIGTIRVLENVFEERRAQVTRYGHNAGLEDGTGPDTRWIPLNGKKTADATAIEKVFREEYLDYEAEHGEPTWMHLVREEVAEAFKEDDPTRLEEELVQIAALCVSWIEKLRARQAEEVLS
jgi:hypothetical protein